MGFIVAMLAPLYSPPATIFAATLFSIPFLAGFLYDWFLVTGKIDPVKGGAFFSKIPSVKALKFLLLFLRLVLVAWLGYFLFDQNLAPVWFFVFIPLMLLLVLGAMGRLAAILILIFLGLLVSDQALDGFYPVFFVLTTIFFFAGTGALSLWSPEEWLIYNRAGE